MFCYNSYMKLLLTSNGITSPEVEQMFDKLTNSRTNLRVAIIPTASDPIEWVLEKEGDVAPYNSVAKLTKERDDDFEKWPLCLYYKNKGFDVIFVDLKEDSTSIKERLHNVDIIDVPGGDVNWLLDWAKKSKLDTYLKDLLNNGVVYVGTSAGSMLLNPDIGFTWWELDKPDDHIGLGIVDFMFQPLHGETDESTVDKLIERKKHMQTLTDYPWKIYLVQDGQAIVVDGDKIEHIGTGTKESV